MIDWKEGKPKKAISVCLVIHQEDYEFGRWNGLYWKIYDGREQLWYQAEEEIKDYAYLNMP